VKADLSSLVLFVGPYKYAFVGLLNDSGTPGSLELAARDLLRLFSVRSCWIISCEEMHRNEVKDSCFAKSILSRYAILYACAAGFSLPAMPQEPESR